MDRHAFGVRPGMALPGMMGGMVHGGMGGLGGMFGGMCLPVGMAPLGGGLGMQPGWGAGFMGGGMAMGGGLGRGAPMVANAGNERKNHNGGERKLEARGYKVIKQLGKGAFGRALLVQDRTGHKHVIKEINMANMPVAEKDLARTEIKVLRTLSHPNIIKYVDHFEDGAVLFIVQEYADSGDMGDLLKGQTAPMSEDKVLDLFVQMLMALSHVHDKQILHRDLKPQNIFLSKNRKLIKLGDFGISTILRNSQALAKTQCGTPYYFSPELCQHRPYNNKSDVWSLGCLFYELLTLRHPFEGMNMRALMQNICKGKYRSIPSNYSKEVQNLVASMLNHDPKKRPCIADVLEMDFIRARMQDLCVRYKHLHEGNEKREREPLRNIEFNVHNRHHKEMDIKEGKRDPPDHNRERGPKPDNHKNIHTKPEHQGYIKADNHLRPDNHYNHPREPKPDNQREPKPDNHQRDPKPEHHPREPRPDNHHRDPKPDNHQREPKSDNHQRDKADNHPREPKPDNYQRLDNHHRDHKHHPQDLKRDPRPDNFREPNPDNHRGARPDNYRREAARREDPHHREPEPGNRDLVHAPKQQPDLPAKPEPDQYREHKQPPNGKPEQPKREAGHHKQKREPDQEKTDHKEKGGFVKECKAKDAIEPQEKNEKGHVLHKPAERREQPRVDKPVDGKDERREQQPRVDKELRVDTNTKEVQDAGQRKRHTNESRARARSHSTGSHRRIRHVRTNSTPAKHQMEDVKVGPKGDANENQEEQEYEQMVEMMEVLLSAKKPKTVETNGATDDAVERQGSN